MNTNPHYRIEREQCPECMDGWTTQRGKGPHRRCKCNNGIVLRVRLLDVPDRLLERIAKEIRYGD